MFDKGIKLTSFIVNQSKNVGNNIRTTANSAGTKWKESSTVTKACIIGSATAVVAPLAILPVLGLAGFTSAGVAAGSAAAYMQTATTVSGSVFALCQSAAATGVVATSTSVAVGLTAGATAGGVTAAVCKKKRRSQNNDENGHAEAGEDAEAEEDAEAGEDAEAEEDAEAGEDAEAEEDAEAGEDAEAEEDAEAGEDAEAVEDAEGGSDELSDSFKEKVE
jgi:hypothetical protein